MILNKARMYGETVRKCRESPDRDAARDRRKRLAVNAKCEVDGEVSMSALKVKKNRKARILCVF